MGTGEVDRSVPRGERSGSGEPFSLERPTDLARNIRSMIQQERERRTEFFNPASWLTGKLDVLATEALRQHQPKNKVQFFDDLRAVWQLVAYEQIDGEHSGSVYTDIRTHTMGRRSITLSQVGGTLLDAMAEALEIPHLPGQLTFDVSLFSGQVAQEKIRHNASSLAPTCEEVKRAITASVDAEK
jgi:hypothetical protein